MRQIAFFLALFSIWGCCAATPWLFDREAFEERLPLGVKGEELIALLEQEGIEVCWEEGKKELLWRGEGVSISLPPHPFSPYHLWIEMEGRSSLEECTREELASLYRAIWRGRRAVQEVTGAQGFMISLRGPQTGPLQIELIPSGFAGSGEVMDAVEKNALNDYAFYGVRRPHHLSPSPEAIEAIRALLPTLIPFLQEEAPQGQWTQKLLHHEKGLYQTLEELHALLSQSNILLEGEMPPPPEERGGVHEIQIDPHKCAFCRPQVIEKQLVTEWGTLYLLMSHKPVSPYGNFLILPKRHQCSWDLTEEEAIDTFEAVVEIQKMFTQTAPGAPWVCYVQDGPSVGQTVPHTHLHFYLLPDRLKSLVTTLQHIHNMRPILSYEEMRSACETVKKSLQERGER